MLSFGNKTNQINLVIVQDIYLHTPSCIYPPAPPSKGHMQVIVHSMISCWSIYRSGHYVSKAVNYTGCHFGNYVVVILALCRLCQYAFHFTSLMEVTMQHIILILSRSIYSYFTDADQYSSYHARFYNFQVFMQVFIIFSFYAGHY